MHSLGSYIILYTFIDLCLFRFLGAYFPRLSIVFTRVCLLVNFLTQNGRNVAISRHLIPVIKVLVIFVIEIRKFFIPKYFYMQIKCTSYNFPWEIIEVFKCIIINVPQKCDNSIMIKQPLIGYKPCIVKHA